LPEAVNDRITEKRKTDILCSEYKLFQVYVNKIRKKSIGSATFITIFSRKGPPVISQMANDLPPKGGLIHRYPENYLITPN
jgi:hypothetical protein